MDVDADLIFSRAARSDVGDSAAPARHRSGQAADQFSQWRSRPAGTSVGEAVEGFRALSKPPARALRPWALSQNVRTHSRIGSGRRGHARVPRTAGRAAAVQKQTAQNETESEVTRLEEMARRFAPVDLSADVSALPPNERQALARMVEAAKMFDALFLRQVWAGNETMLLDLVRDTSDARPRAAPLLSDQQGTVVAPGRGRAVHCRRSGEAGAGATSIRPGRRRRRSRRGSTRCPMRSGVAPRDSSRPSAAAPTASSSRCRTASSIRASWRTSPSCCARRPALTSNRR